MKFFGIGEENKIKELDKNLEDEKNKDIGQITLDILETDLEIIILAPIAGISLEKIDISFNNGVLTISGKRKKPSIFDKNHTIRNSECFWGKFMRNIILPENLDFDTIEATMENNLLIINIKKLQFNSNNIKINKVEEE